MSHIIIITTVVQSISFQDRIPCEKNALFITKWNPSFIYHQLKWFVKKNHVKWVSLARTEYPMSNAIRNMLIWGTFIFHFSMASCSSLSKVIYVHFVNMIGGIKSKLCCVTIFCKVWDMSLVMDHAIVPPIMGA